MLFEKEFLDLLKSAKEKMNPKKSVVDSFTSPLSKEFATAAAESKSVGKGTVKTVDVSGAIPSAPPLAPVSRSMAGIVTSTQPRQSATEARNDQLWVDKYKPSQMEHMIGSNEIISKLS